MSYGAYSHTNPSDGTSGGGLCQLVEAATTLSKLVDTKQGEQPTSLSPKKANPMSVSDDEENLKKHGIAGNKREIFPQRLLAILNDPSLTDVVTWLPNGRSFVIVRPDVFTETVLPKYLPPVDARGSTKYPSFTRKLNRWGFRQITRGPDTGAFHHPLFRRDEPQMCLQMVCQRSRDRRSSSKQTNFASGALPPKKRMMSPTGTVANEPATTMKPQTSVLALPARDACVVSSDDSSSTSGSTTKSSTSSMASQVTLMNVPAPLSTVCPKTELRPVLALPHPSAPYVSNDELVIQDALRRSEENERIRTAKAMLYHSYMQALRGR